MIVGCVLILFFNLSMYLEKIKIQGFKSFANKNVLVFSQKANEKKKGITAIVGPNGSGKSNIADAVRWVLGEQSMKTLRGKKSEDIIFSGSAKKGNLGMAEVSLYLNNDDKKINIDYSEIVITRRLYRNGDSEYFINKSITRLSDIQIMLAKANFGQKTYSVIGQGLVGSFLNTSFAERKEFFYEATGVKQFQIKRDFSLNKLRISHENLSQVNMLSLEIEPRLNSLLRQVNKLKKRDEIIFKLKNIQIQYYGKLWSEMNYKFNEYNNKFLKLDQIKRDNDKKLDTLSRNLEKAEECGKENCEFQELQNILNKLQIEKDVVIKDLASIDAQLEVNFELNGRFDLSWLNNKKGELEKDIKNVEKEIVELLINISDNKKIENIYKQEKDSINNQLKLLNNEMFEFNLNSSSNDNKKDLRYFLNSYLLKFKKIDTETSIKKIKDIVKQIKNGLKEIVNNTKVNKDKEKIEKVQNKIIKLTNKKEEMFVKINKNNLKILACNERIKLLDEKKYQIKKEFLSIEKKIKQNKNKINLDKINNDKNKFKKQFNFLEEKIKLINDKIRKYNIEAENKRNKIFLVQKNIQFLQNEINDISYNLSELKVNSTRYETKLENLEIEIRQNLGNLNDVKKYKIKDSDNLITVDTINKLKQKIDLIGGIDPLVEKEFIETKERFDFLFKQSNDLIKTIKSLEKIVKELDVVIRKKFDREFTIISKKFEEYFKILFNGGNAKIVKLINIPDDDSEATKNKEVDVIESVDFEKNKFFKKHNATGLAGIEIQATPPGKKIKSISMLSGGERALTAIAMISAIISVNPSPFVVFDEVDAALDESNSERLARILDDLSSKTQFIVITHKRASMCCASTLYGVTMGIDGVSKLLSIKLDNIKAI